MKEKILAKIEEMDEQFFNCYQLINEQVEDYRAEYTDELEEFDPDIFYYKYNGEHIGHVLDILDENMYLLRRLKSFIEGLES